MGPSARIAWLLAVVVVALGALRADAARASIGSYVLVDAASGAVIAADNPFQPWYPASITKLMTAYVTFRAVREGRISGTSPVVMTANAAAEPPSKMGFKVGTVLTVDTAVKIIIVKSANDVTMALAEAVGGSESAFVAMMNAEARRLGMTTTHFNNPHGLPDDGQLTSARDMAILTRALLDDFPEHRSLFRITALKLGKQMIRTHNRLLERYRGTDGMKTGFICNSGFNMVATATKGGRTLIAVVLGAYSAGERNEFAARLFEEGFAGSGPLISGRRVALAQFVAPPGTPATPGNRRQFVCGPNRVAAQQAEGEQEDDKADPAVRKTYLEPRFETMAPVAIALGGATGVGAGSVPGAVSVAGVVLPLPRPDRAAGVAPTAIAPADQLAPEFDPGAAAAAAAAGEAPVPAAATSPSPPDSTASPAAKAPAAPRVLQPRAGLPQAPAATAFADPAEPQVPVVDAGPTIASAAHPGLKVPVALLSVLQSKPAAAPGFDPAAEPVPAP